MKIITLRLKKKKVFKLESISKPWFLNKLVTRIGCTGFLWGIFKIRREIHCLKIIDK